MYKSLIKMMCLPFGVRVSRIILFLDENEGIEY